MNDITKKELQEIQEQLESIMQYGLADKLQNIIDDNSIPVDKPVKVNFAEEMYKAIKFTLDYDKREIRENDDYEVSFLYPANNLSYQKLLKAVKMYEDSKISA